MSNPNYRLVAENPELFESWLNECLDPEDSQSDELGYWDEDGVRHSWGEGNDPEMVPHRTWRDWDRKYRL